MYCKLFCTGTDFDVNAFIRTSSWKKVDVFHKGESTPSTRDYSGFSVEISEEEFLDPLIKDAITFLKENAKELERLRASFCIDEIELQVGLSWFENTVCYSVSIPTSLLQLTNKYDISLEINTYAVALKNDAHS